MSQIESFVERGGKYAGRKQEWGEGKGGRVEQNGDTSPDEMRRRRKEFLDMVADMEVDMVADKERGEEWSRMVTQPQMR